MFPRRVWTIVFTVLLVPVISAAQAPGPRLALEEIERIAGQATESVNVSLDSSLLGLAVRFLDGDDEESRALKAVAGGLKGIYVRSYTFDKDGGYPASVLDGVRRQMAGPGWSRMMGVRSREAGGDVDVYLWQEGGQARGLGILASGPRELTIVNILGTIDLDQLRKLEGLGVPRLEIEREKAREKADKAKPKPGKDRVPD